MPKFGEKLSYQLTWQQELGIEPVAAQRTPVPEKNPPPISDDELIDEFIGAVRNANHGLEIKLRKELMRRLKKLR